MNQVSIYEKATFAQLSAYSNATWTRLGVDLNGPAGGGSTGGQRDVRRVVDLASVLVDKMIM